MCVPEYHLGASRRGRRVHRGSKRENGQLDWVLKLPLLSFSILSEVLKSIRKSCTGVVRPLYPSMFWPDTARTPYSNSSISFRPVATATDPSSIHTTATPHHLVIFTHMPIPTLGTIVVV